MKDKKIYRTLINNYIIFVILVLCIFIGSIIYWGKQMEQRMDNEASPNIEAYQIVKADYKNMDTSHIEALGGWIEILNKDNAVVYVKGEKKTLDYKYTTFEITDLIGQSEGEFIYTSKSFTGPNGGKYICVAVIPGNVLDIKMNIKPTLRNMDYSVNQIFISVTLKALILFIVLFLINIFLYSKLTAKKITNPLNKITEAITEMSNGSHEVRMDFKAENEFLQIKDAFNYMAEKLQESEREKEKIENSRKRMFMDISHDLKTPITTICGYSKALDEKMVDDEERKQRYLRTIYEKSLRVTNLINNLFELSKLENTELKLKKEKYDIVEFLRGIAAEHFEQMEDKGIILDLKLPHHKIIYNFDRKEMERAAANLVHNAIEYNTEGTKLRIELKEIGDKIIIEIGDNGRGIPENLKNIIFDPFVRGDINRNSTGGTGLGLAIAKKVVEAHGGTLILSTDEGDEKTVFRICL